MHITQKVRKFLGSFFSTTNAASTSIAERFEMERILGFSPRKLSIYRLAFRSKQISEGAAYNNERLEFLGDSMIATSVASYLFKQYPYQGEHFMTEMRSKIVNREMLNSIAKNMGIDKIVNQLHRDSNMTIETGDVYGNTLEALVGAILVDQGYKKADWWTRGMLENYVNLQELENVDINIKNKLFSWAAQHDKKIEFLVDNVSIVEGKRIFTTSVKIDEYLIATAQGKSKKESSFSASQLAAKALNINEI